jgi:hypothetical protein
MPELRVAKTPDIFKSVKNPVTITQKKAVAANLMPQPLSHKGVYMDLTSFNRW